MTRILRVWDTIDRILLGGVFLLLGWAFYSLFCDVQSSEVEVRQPAGAVGISEKRRASSPSVSLPIRQVAERFSSGNGGARFSRALDMREHDRAYEICLSVPEGLRKDAVHLSSRGHILSLVMALPDGTHFSRQIRMPERIRAGQVAHQLTNGVLRIRVLP